VRVITDLQKTIDHYKIKAKEARRRAEKFKKLENEPIQGYAKFLERERISNTEARNHEQLADWLTELQERREADRWISVKERMPEPRVEVMVYCLERKTQYCAFYADKHWQIFGSYDTVWGEVTHWKTLPKAPESEAENEQD